MLQGHRVVANGKVSFFFMLECVCVTSLSIHLLADHLFLAHKLLFQTECWCFLYLKKKKPTDRPTFKGQWKRKNKYCFCIIDEPLWEDSLKTPSHQVLLEVFCILSDYLKKIHLCCWSVNPSSDPLLVIRC